jgi:type I restriction enzyme S subunit
MTCQTAGGEILGVPVRIPHDERLYLHNQRLGKVVVTQPEKVDSSYLYWLFLWSEFNRALFVSASGTKILHTAPSRIEEFRFRLPPLPEQRAIAHILGTLDDKIDLNRQMNETLEGIARAIFKSWFIDFDPVRWNMQRKEKGRNQPSPRPSPSGRGSEPVYAKAEGREPGLPTHIADLFPDSFKDSELGEIPKGWTIEPLSEITTVITNAGVLPATQIFRNSLARQLCAIPLPAYDSRSAQKFSCFL